MKIIFLISMPRSGSTLLQRMLGSHSEVHTVSEPWLMLHPLYALRLEGHKAIYDEKLAYSALQDLLGSLPKREATYYEAVQLMANYIYGSILSQSGKSLFLDKTPRYYLILPELKLTFPNAHFIFLLRNPVAVLSSIITTWIGHDWLKISYHYNDLLLAPCLICNGIYTLGDRATIVHYEELVTRPEKVVSDICTKVGINFQKAMIEYGRKEHTLWNLGDQATVHRRTRPVDSSVDKWILQAEDPQAWRLMMEYLQCLGPSLLSKLGYNYDELKSLLREVKPTNGYLLPTFSLKWLLTKPNEDRARWERYLVHGIGAVRRHGVAGSITAGFRKGKDKLAHLPEKPYASSTVK